MDYAEFETEVDQLVAPEVAAWSLYERYVAAAFDADKDPEEAADEVTAQFNAH